MTVTAGQEDLDRQSESRPGASLRRGIAEAPPHLAAVGSLASAAVALAAVQPLRSKFPTPTGGVGVLTLTAYPKSFDYFELAVILIAAFAGALLAGLVGSRSIPARTMEKGTARPGTGGRRFSGILIPLCFLVVYAAYYRAHASPYYELDYFHDGEHLSPASELIAGARPYADVFFLHGLAVDGGLDWLALGDPPDPLRARRLQGVMDAATVALLVPLAAEATVTWAGFLIAVVAGFAALGAGQVAVFPYFRLAPLLLVGWAALRHARTERLPSLAAAAAAGTLGVLWSLEVGLYAVAGFCVWLMLHRLLFARPARISSARLAVLLASAAAAPLLILVAARADIGQFLVDSFVVIPRSIDAVWSLPAPPLPDVRTFESARSVFDWIDSESARYYLPPVLYGLLAFTALRDLAAGRRERAERAAVLLALSIFAFRTAAGRSGWSHNRFAVPLLGAILGGLVFEPLWLCIRSGGRRLWVPAMTAIVLCVPCYRWLEIGENYSALIASWNTWSSRIRPPVGSVPNPLPRGRGLYTYPENAADLTALAGFADRHDRGKPIFVFSGEKALYYLLDRRSSTRVHDVPMLSAPPLEREALLQLERNPPAFVVLQGIEAVANFDGVSNRVRAPAVAGWIDAHYPRRERVGRFLLALPAPG